MSGDWSSPQRGHAPNHEYEVVADLWLSNKSGALTGVRKLQTAQHRKKNNDKRDSVVQLAALAEGTPKKLREKSSWLGMSRGYANLASADGQWVRVRCTLAEMQEGRTESEWILTIIGDKANLQHSLNVKMLRTTDIRFADRSLVFRGDCLSIHARPDAFMAHSPSLQTLLLSAAEQALHRQTQRWQHANVPVLDPIYLAFESKDAVNCWSALLRSYAQPEIYGTDAFRMWRQVDLTVMHGRNFGVLGKLASTDALSRGGSLSDVERGDAPTETSADSPVFCEVFIDGQISGRTMYQKGQTGTGSEPTNWTWLESFTLADLPPFGFLTLRVWRMKKSTKTTLIGTVEITLSHFRRGQTVEGWFPVMSCTQTGNNSQVGDLKLKMRVDEEVILPSDAYSTITNLLDGCNCLELLSELDQKMQLGDVSNHMLAFAVGRGTFLKDIVDLAEREIDRTPNPHTLFRGNSIFTKTVEQAMSLFGRPFLEASVGPCIQELCMERVELEIDPSRNQKGPKDLEQSVKLLPIWCNKFWSNIYKVRDCCPPELRRVFQAIRELVGKRFADDKDLGNLRCQSVSAFCFLRLIVPAILHPHLWGLHPGLPSPGLQRSLTLIAKVLQSLANLSKEKRESYMGGVTSFLEQNTGLMKEYIGHISSPLPDRGLPDHSGRYDRLLIMHSLRDRREQTKVLTPLVSEAIPVLPHLLDIPKHLAVLSSAVIRHSRTIPQSVTSRPVPRTQEVLVDEFAAKCFEIEKTVQSVSRLASPPQSANAAPRHSQKIHSRRSQGRTGRPSDSTRRSPVSSAGESWKLDARKISHPLREPDRPSTAPATSSSTTSSSAPHTPLPSSPTIPLLGMISDDSDNSLSQSPNSQVLEKQQGAPSMLTKHASLRATSSRSVCQPLPTKLRRTLSQQLNPQEIEGMEDALAKRRGGLLRSLLTRTPK